MKLNFHRAARAAGADVVGIPPGEELCGHDAGEASSREVEVGESCQGDQTNRREHGRARASPKRSAWYQGNASGTIHAVRIKIGRYDEEVVSRAHLYVETCFSFPTLSSGPVLLCLRRVSRFR